MKNGAVPGWPLVSLCMIVKNEEANLAACLASVKDLLTEIILVDTGSTDATKKVARRLGATVFDFAWVDSFAAARNESLRHATGDWIFWLDADDRLDDDNLSRLRQLLNHLPGDNAAFLMRVYSAADPQTGQALLGEQVRLFRHDLRHCWRHRVHEQVLPALEATRARLVRPDIVIQHLGYQDQALRRYKLERNLRLLQLELAESPSEPFVLFNLACAYLDLGQTSLALEQLERCLAVAPAAATFLPRAFALLAQGNRLLGQEVQAWRFCQIGRERFPQAVELWFEEGVLRQARRDLAGARLCFEQILALPPEPCLMVVDVGLQGYRCRHNLALVYRDLGWLGRAEEQWRLVVQGCPDFGPAWLALAELLIKQQRQPEVQELIKKLSDRTAAKIIVPALQARLCLSGGDAAGACATLERALIQAPQASWLRLLLAEILLRMGQENNAEHQLREVLAQEPQQKQAQRKLARLLMKRGSAG